MKKLLFLLFVVVLFSCEKDAEYCWTCLVTKVTSFPGGSSSITSTVTPCNMSTRDMERFEQKENARCTRQ